MATSRGVAALLAAVFTGLAVLTIAGAPLAAAQPCKTNEVLINNQCTAIQNAANPPTLPPGTPGKVQCSQHSCVYYPDN